MTGNVEGVNFDYFKHIEYVEERLINVLIYEVHNYVLAIMVLKKASGNEYCFKSSEFF
ncbi:hypothetical protein K6025_00490 [Ehrlichia sp. JZT12]